jgi:hypothetical protein
MAKRTVESNLAHAAKILGKKGGNRRKEVLDSAERSAIAKQGGDAKSRKVSKK